MLAARHVIGIDTERSINHLGELFEGVDQLINVEDLSMVAENGRSD